MKFSTTIAVAVLGVAANAFHLPSSASKRATSPVAVLQSDISQLQVLVGNDLAEISESDTAHKPPSSIQVG
jgi:hypothetical protein